MPQTVQTQIISSPPLSYRFLAVRFGGLAVAAIVYSLAFRVFRGEWDAISFLEQTVAATFFGLAIMAVFSATGRKFEWMG